MYFPNSKGNSKATSLYISVCWLTYHEMHQHLMWTQCNPNAILLKEFGSSSKKSSKFGFRFLGWKFRSKGLLHSEVKCFKICRLKAINNLYAFCDTSNLYIFEQSMQREDTCSKINSTTMTNFGFKTYILKLINLMRSRV